MKKFISLFLLIFSFVGYSQPTINGDMSESEYTTIATKQNSNNGFGAGMDVSSIVYYPDVANSILYFGVVGNLNATFDGIGIWINISGSGSPDGTAAGNSLGGITGAGHYMQDASNPNFKADFEVDYMFAINPGGSSSDCYVNAASRVGAPSGVYLGNCGQSGSSLDYSTTGIVFANGHTITFAFNNGGGTKQGFEIKIPFAAIGASSSMNLSAFAFLVSNTAYFSDVTVPGNRIGGNPGFNAEFNSYSGGPYNSGDQALPVELKSFTALANSNSVLLNWATATEINNYGFEIERKSITPSLNFNNWEMIGFVKGNGTSNSTKNYSYLDKNLSAGKYAYRLKQIDIDGSSNYSNEVEVEIKNVTTFSLEQNYPNPFNPGTIISWQSPVSGHQTLKIYDVLGNEVSTLVDEFREAGSYQYEFIANQLSSGIYFYKLQIGDFVQTRKMILMQ